MGRDMYVTVVPKCVPFGGMAGKVIGFMLKIWSPKMIVLERTSESLEFTLPPFAQRKSHGYRELRWPKILTHLYSRLPNGLLHFCLN